MKRLLASTTALSVALSPMSGVPVFAQTQLEDGSVVAEDGSILCTPTAEEPCDLKAILKALAKDAEKGAKGKGQEDAEAAAAEAAAAEAAAAEAAVSDATAAADAAAAEAAAAEAEAEKAAADAAAAEQAAAEKAAADAAAAEQAAADQAAADAAAAAEAAAAEQAAAEAAAAEAAAAEAAAATRAADEAAAAEAAAAEAAAAEKAAAEQAAAEAAAADQAAAEAAAADQAAAEQAAADQAAAEAAAADQAAAEQAAADQAAAEAAAADQAAAEKAAADQAAAEQAAAEQAAADQAAAEKAASEARNAEADAAAAEQAAAEAEAAAAKRAANEQAAAEAAAAEQAAAEQAAAEQAAAAAVEAAPVEAPVPESVAVEMLDALIGAPTVTEEAIAAEEAARGADGEGTAAVENDGVTVGAEVMLPEAAAAIAEAEAAANAATASEAPPVSAPTSVTESVVTEEDSRSSDEEFVPAPTAVAGGRKSGLSDLEKVGLVALGALVVGAVLSNGRQVVENTGDRVVVRDPDGRYVVYKDDDALLRRPGVTTTTENFRDGSTRTIVERVDGTQIVTIRDASGRVLRRAAYDQQGRELVLIDDLQREVPIIVSELPKPKPSRVVISTQDGDATLKAELAALEAAELGRKFSLRQIREIQEVRALAATIEVDNITFDSGSSVIRTTEARKLADLGRIMNELLKRNPGEVFLIEGHTDAVGGASMNLALSDRRAESVALALTEYFEIPPENLVVQGYGESELKVATAGDERANRRANVRLITALMQQASN